VSSFRCPGCGKQHVTENEFEQDFETRCLRCGETFQVTEEIVHGDHVTNPTLDDAGTLDDAITVQRPTRHVSPAGKEDEGVIVSNSPLEDVLDAEDADETKPSGPARTGQRLRYVRKANGLAGGMRRPENVGEEAKDDDRSDNDEKPERHATRQGDPNEKKTFTLPRWIIAAFAAVGIIVVGAGAYFVFIRGAVKKPPEKVVAEKKKKETIPATTPAVGTDNDKPGEPLEKPSVAPKVPEVIPISAARLSAELASNADETNEKYANAALEVSGLFEKVQTKPSDQSSPLPHAVFAGEGPPISCDLSASPTDMNRWRTLPHEQPITVRGTYGKNGFLHVCELLPLTPPAERKYKGKEIELVGLVDAMRLLDGRDQFPTVVLEAETHCRVEVNCLFRKTDEEAVRKLQPGTPIAIRGTCNGRTRAGENYRIRIDNCQVVYTSAPVASAPRLEVAAFLREYEEDLRPTLLPPPGMEDFITSPVSVLQLSKELALDTKAIDRYRNKIIIVSGKLHQKFPPTSLILESGDTDQVLKVQCVFGRRNFGDLENATEYRIRGLCTGWLDAKTIRLDDCESFDPAKNKDSRRLTAEFLPHVPDRVLTYDLAVFPLAPGTTPVVSRQVFLERERGLTETVTTHTGRLPGKSLFDAGEPSNWITQKKTQKVRLPGPTYQWRVSAGFVEVGQHIPAKGGELELVWEPVLKLLAKTGDSWKWTHANAQHQYKVVKFDKDQGGTSVVIQETITPRLDPDHPFEIRHVYMRDLGEVERRESQQISSKEKRILTERKLIEDGGTSSSKDSGRE